MSPDIRELFDSAADDSGRDDLDASALVRRGRRKVRTRQAVAAAGAAAVLVAAVVGASQLTLPRSGGPVPPAHTPTTPVPGTSSAPSSSSAGPTSGTGAAVLRKLTYAEGVRRCKVRMAAEYGDERATPNPSEPIDPGTGLQFGMYVTDLLRMKLSDGSEAYCSVPGPTTPKYDAGGGSGPRGVCGDLSWLNLADWKFAVQNDGQGGFAAALISPDRKAVLLCDQDGSGATREKSTAFPDAYVCMVYGPASGQPAGSAPNGVVGCAIDGTPIRFLGAVKAGRQFWGGGGIATNGAVRYALFAGTRQLAETSVTDGIYALRVWLPKATEPTEVRAYDATGKVIDSYQPF
ncbi:hypothetical protein [Kribbella deserti]|uniref:Serine/threonine protein kinase n=1 Tax=Kribbella deserti TaxID=1926257 RepID=A0ABV6QRA6_9ACTN